MSDHSSFRTPAGGVAVLGSAVFGAVVGGAVAAAESIPKVRSGQMDRRAAAMMVAREAGTTGAATGAAVAVVGALGLGGILSLVGIVAVATGSKYLLDAAFRPAPAVPAPSPLQEAEPAAEPSAASGKDSGTGDDPDGTAASAKPVAGKATKSTAKGKPADARTQKTEPSAKPDVAHGADESEEIKQ
ncbi:MAG: hypothetical protein AB7E32_08045 [Desulfovibrio sp.]